MTGKTITYIVLWQVRKVREVCIVCKYTITAVAVLTPLTRLMDIPIIATS